MEVARKLGADKTVLIGKDDKMDDIVEKIRTDSGDLPDCTLECSGTEFGVNLGIMATTFGGRLVTVGCLPDMVTIPLIIASTREVTIVGVYRYANW